MAKADPLTARCKIVRFNKEDPEKYETVDIVKGKAAAIRKLHKLRKEEPNREKYGYYWKFIDKVNDNP